jgi:serine/threonine protein kinase
MSPEQWKNAKRVSDKTDVYALGVMMVEMLTGKPPFRGKYAHELMNQHLEEAPNLAKVPAEVRDVLATCLDKKPGSRPTLNKLLAFVRAWQRAAVEEPGPATKRPTAKSKKQPRQKSHAKEDKREKAPPVARKKSNKHKPLKAPVAQQPSDQPASDDAGRAQGTVMFLCIASAIILLAAALIYFRDALVAWAR